MPEICIQPPRMEPLDLAEVKLHLRVTEDSQDALISALIVAAREAAEMKTRRQIIHARWQLTLDRFPRCIVLPHSPCARVVSITYLDMAGVQQTMDAADYTLNSAQAPAIVTPRFGKIWPIPLPQSGAVQVTYDAGWASPLSIDKATGITPLGPLTWSVGDDVVFFNSGGQLPKPLQARVPYKINAATSGLYTIKSAGGSPITLTDSGTGTSYMASLSPGLPPIGLLQWIKIRCGSLYEHREEVAILNRGVVAELPFMEGLLDPYRTALP